ncbi:LuxR C-terminal-related transcriptional regulator [Streptomyces sp. NPDC056528]|uniref:LuxR C-terminal-related transcriptional regulator n=1 Tax=Streptomyces sp. NPDC056528 TaxID=3345854 RepID=UPI0036B464B4
MSTKVLICDRLPLVRDGLRTVLDACPDIDVVATTDSSMQTAMLARTHRPDIVLIGLDEPAPDLELIRRLSAEEHPDGRLPRVVVFQFDYTDSVVADLLTAGVKGLISRDSTSDDVIAATRLAARGRTVLSPDIVDRLVGWFRDRDTIPPAGDRPEADALTRREREVLRLIGQGMSIEDAAAELYIGVSTVRTHLHRVRHKLALKDRAQLVAFAYQAGIMREAA